MSRPKRYYSKYMHIVTRGINRQLMFEDNEDRYFFMNMIKKYKVEENISVIAFCLMDNHVHMLICDPEANVSTFMRRLGVTYSMYFNRKYSRCGYFFQNRFSSQVISDEAYMRTVFKYILMNPEKAGICRYSRYRWSTIHESGLKDTVTDFDVLNELLGNIPLSEIKSEEEDFSGCIDVDLPKHDDTWAVDVMRKSLGVTDGTEIHDMPLHKRDSAVLLLIDNGLTERQVSRLTGIGRGIIRKILKERTA